MLGPQTLDQEKGLQARHDGISLSSWKPKLQDQELKASLSSMLSVRPLQNKEVEIVSALLQRV